MKKILVVYGGKFHPYKEAVEILENELKNEFEWL